MAQAVKGLLWITYHKIFVRESLCGFRFGLPPGEVLEPIGKASKMRYHVLRNSLC